MSATTSLVTRTDFVCVPTRDFARAVEFYGTTLGLRCSARWGAIDGAEFETGNLTLAVVDPSAIGQEFRPLTPGIALRVDDVAAARAQLEARGVAFAGDIIDSGVCHMALFRDPDGNALILHHRYAPREA
jgi:catechol 2,3-dioxygenase-like lactoylglutathione lyase family enzyme